MCLSPLVLAPLDTLLVPSSLLRLLGTASIGPVRPVLAEPAPDEVDDDDDVRAVPLDASLL